VGGGSGVDVAVWTNVLVGCGVGLAGGVSVTAACSVAFNATTTAALKSLVAFTAADTVAAKSGVEGTGVLTRLGSVPVQAHSTIASRINLRFVFTSWFLEQHL